MAVSKSKKPAPLKQKTLLTMFGASSSSSPAPSSRRASSPPPSTMPSSPTTRESSPSESIEVCEEQIIPEIDVPVINLVDEDDEELSEEDKEKWVKLGPFLEKVQVYASVLKQQMESTKATYVPAKPVAKAPKLTKKPVSTRQGRRAKRAKTEPEDAEDDAHANEGAPVDEEEIQAFKQPALVTGAKLKDYQLEGVAWMVGLYQNGISGILADEMGLGKTLQTIAFHALLRELTPAPFMVVCPLSVLNNWADEFKKFAPEIPVCVYHGSPDERAEIRRTQMIFHEADRKYWLGPASQFPTSGSSSAPQSSKKRKTNPSPVKNSRSKAASSRRSSTRGARKRKAESEDEDEDEAQKQDKEEEMERPDLPPNQKTTFPVVLTTFEIVMKDRAELSMYHWGFLVVDEGHRLKNMECRLMRELKALPVDSRMVLTGTPLHNNLAELWSLLNFVLPDLFTDLDTFQEWFNLPTTSSASPRATKFINVLHSVLRPFLLRRMKADVEANLPPKKEYVLYAPLSRKQREVYDAVLTGHLRALLLKAGKTIDDNQNIVDAEKSASEEEENVGPRKSKRKAAKKRKMYDDDGDDDEYFRKLDNGELEAERLHRQAQDADDVGREWQRKAQTKKVNNMKLQNTVMQLRKVCSHPFLFDWPTDPRTQEQILNHELVSASGKMMLLQQLLDELFKTDHKVLLFSQFTTMLDIIEDWAVQLKGWSICRIDGSTPMATRREEVKRFQTSGDAPDAPRLFLLSTRAGGLGLNLVAADTVIFYDQDWNPQMDLQAQDRAHRIGQTRPVLIFRLVSAHTIETKIMQRATEKRKLEALVIAKGKFRAPNQAANGPVKSRAETMAELAASLLRLEGEQINVALEGQSVISDKDLEVLLDRRPEVFADRGKGWTSNKLTKHENAESKTAFAVYEAPVDVGGDALAGMMGEEIES